MTSTVERALAVLRSAMPLDGWFFLVVCPLAFVAFLVFVAWEERDWQDRGYPPAQYRWPHSRDEWPFVNRRWRDRVHRP